jgi:hypothetical protein
MDREGEYAGRASEEAANGFPPFEAAERGAFPERVLGKQRGDAVRVVVRIAQRGVAGLEVADGFGVLKGLKTLFDPFEPGQGMTFVPT